METVEPESFVSYLRDGNKSLYVDERVSSLSWHLVLLWLLLWLFLVRIIMVTSAYIMNKNKNTTFRAKLCDVS